MSEESSGIVKTVAVVGLLGVGVAIGIEILGGGKDKAELSPAESKREEDRRSMTGDLADGGVGPVVYLKDGGTKELQQFPCAWKRKEKDECTRIDGGEVAPRITMQPGEWAGPGCVRKNCMVFAGEADLDPEERLTEKRRAAGGDAGVRR